MSLNTVKLRTSERFNEVLIFLNYVSSLEPDNPTEPVSLEVKIMKGLFYVHLYSAFEKSINDTVETVLSLISSKNVKNSHLLAPVLSVVLTDKIKSLKDCGYAKVFIKSSDIFVDAASTNITPINETIFSNHLQNVWVKTIDEIFHTLGINSLRLDIHSKTTIDEIVERRNAVAHGRDSAASVGERYRTDVLREKMETVSSSTYEIIYAIEDHYLSKRYIKSTVRRYYA